MVLITRKKRAGKWQEREANSKEWRGCGKRKWDARVLERKKKYVESRRGRVHIL